jgi:hypothetical protein
MAKNTNLNEFSFDDDEDFAEFGGKVTKIGNTDIETVIKNVKDEESNEVENTNDEDDDETKVTKIDDKPTKATKASKKENKDDEVDEDNVDWNFGDEPTKKVDNRTEEEKAKDLEAKTKVKKKQEETTDEEDDDEEKDEKPVKKKDKTEEKDDDNESEEDEEDEETTFTAFAFDLKDRGFFQEKELKKDDKFTEDSFYEAIDEEVEARAGATIDAFMEELGEDGKKFLKFVKEGGRAADYVHYLLPPLDFDKFDENDPKQVDRVIHQYLVTKEELDGEDLEDRKATLKEGGKKKEWAVKWNNKLKADHDKKVEAVQAAIKNKAQKDEEAEKEFENELKEVLSKTNDVAGVTITEADKKSLNSFILKPTVKVGKNKFVPELNVALHKIMEGKTKEAKKQLLLLAKLLKNNFDFSDLKSDKETTTIKQAQSRVKEARASGRISGGSKVSSSKKSVADYF